MPKVINQTPREPNYFVLCMDEECFNNRKKNCLHCGEDSGWVAQCPWCSEYMLITSADVGEVDVCDFCGSSILPAVGSWCRADVTFTEEEVEDEEEEIDESDFEEDTTIYSE